MGEEKGMSSWNTAFEGSTPQPRARASQLGASLPFHPWKIQHKAENHQQAGANPATNGEINLVQKGHTLPVKQARIKPLNMRVRLQTTVHTALNKS